MPPASSAALEQVGLTNTVDMLAEYDSTTILDNPVIPLFWKLYSILQPERFRLGLQPLILSLHHFGEQFCPCCPAFCEFLPQRTR